MKHKELTDKILQAYFTVYNRLGYGFLERVYEKAMLIELQKMGLSCSAQVPIRVWYEGEVVGKYYADILVEDLVILELKASETVVEEHKIQLVNYLKATEIEIGLLLNFGKEPHISRKIFENRFKRPQSPEQ
jgi:GxxExxY protein